MAENNSLLDKLDGLVSRFEEVSTLITDPAVIADQKRYVKLTKEYKDLGKIVEARKAYIGCLQNVADAKEMLAIEEDAETKEMLREELSESEKRIPELEEEIKLLLVPADPEDDKNIVLEIRGGTGGDEAALFAGDLFRMYSQLSRRLLRHVVLPVRHGFGSPGYGRRYLRPQLEDSSAHLDPGRHRTLRHPGIRRHRTAGSDGRELLLQLDQPIRRRRLRCQRQILVCGGRSRRSILENNHEHCSASS